MSCMSASSEYWNSQPQWLCRTRARHWQPLGQDECLWHLWTIAAPTMFILSSYYVQTIFIPCTYYFHTIFIVCSYYFNVWSMNAWNHWNIIETVHCWGQKKSQPRLREWCPWKSIHIIATYFFEDIFVVFYIISVLEIPCFPILIHVAMALTNEPPGQLATAMGTLVYP